MYFNTLSLTDFNIVEFLLRQWGKSFSIRQISKSIGQDYRIVFLSATKLEKLDLIKSDRIGKAKNCSLNLRKDVIPLISFISTRIKERFLKKNPHLQPLITDLTTKIKNPYYSIIVFGSYAKGTNRKDSDLDVLFIIPGEKEAFESQINSILRITPLPTHPIILSYKEFMEGLTPPQPTISKEALENHVLLYGAEAFYKMVIL